MAARSRRDRGEIARAATSEAAECRREFQRTPAAARQSKAVEAAYLIDELLRWRRLLRVDLLIKEEEMPRIGRLAHGGCRATRLPVAAPLRI